MRVLVLEPVYSSFHRDLAKRLDPGARALVFSWGPAVYLGGLSKTFLPRAVSKIPLISSDVELVRKCRSLYMARVHKIERSTPAPEHLSFMARYVAYLRSYLQVEAIDLVIMHNDLRWQHALAIVVCRELGVRYLVTERGLFRPHTTTLDMEGVNANCSAGAMFADLAYEDHDAGTPLKSVGPTRLGDLLTKTRFALFLLMEACGRLLGQCSPVRNKTFALSDYVRLQWLQSTGGLFRGSAVTGVSATFDSCVSTSRLVFVPLQVSDDTQLLIHSDFESVQQFINAVERAFFAVDRQATLVFKLHPMEPDPSRYRFDPRSRVTRVDTSKMVEVADCVVTVNSTVGFEALMLQKPVIVLGRAFYAQPGLTMMASPDDLPDALARVLVSGWRPDARHLERFIAFVRDRYQWNFNLFSYKEDDIQELAARLKAIVDGDIQFLLRS